MKRLHLVAAVTLMLSALLFANSPSTPQRGAFKSTMAGLPQNVRSQFLESMMFSNGQLATAYVGGIKSSLTPGQYGQVLMALGIRTGEDHDGYECLKTATCSKKTDNICIGNLCQVLKIGAARLGTALARVSMIDRSRFLDSLDFANGRLVSANVASVRTGLRQPELEELFSGLGVSPAELQRTTGETFSR